MKVNNKALKCLLNIDYLITGAALVGLITVTFLGVIMRYFLNNPFIWLEEVQIWCFVWLVFFGAGAAFRTGSHVAIDVIVDLFPPKVKKAVEICVYLVVMAVLFYLMMHGANLVRQMVNTGRMTNILKVPYSMIYASLPIGCGLMMINYTIMTAASLFTKKADMEGGAEEWI